MKMAQLLSFIIRSLYNKTDLRAKAHLLRR
jgi:hypothetical protein